MGHISEWVNSKGYSCKTTKLFDDEPFPGLNEFDFLIILGGLRKVAAPWLEKEIDYIRSVIESKKMVLGICLGAQLIAQSLGGKLISMEQREFGWWPIQWNSEFDFLPSLSKSFMAFQSHQITFTLPANCIRLAQTAAALNQAFIYENHVVRIQFHPEVTEEKIHSIANENCRNEGELFFQPKDQWFNQYDYMNEAKIFLFTLLDQMEALFNNQQERQGD